VVYVDRPLMTEHSTTSGVSLHGGQQQPSQEWNESCRKVNAGFLSNEKE